MERKYSIDLLRILSAVAVVLIHIVSAPVANSSAVIDSAVATNLNLIHTLMNWSVPVFFMITGYCLQKKKEVTYEYCFSHVMKYIGVLFTIGLAYALMEEVFTARTINGAVLVQSILNVISGNLWDHMWFIYSIIGIYLVMPVIHLFISKDDKNAVILTVLLFVFTILLPTFEKYFSIGVTIPFGGYLFYVCFGSTIAKLKINPRFSIFIPLFGVLSVIWIFLENPNGKFEYTHLTICVMAISIFLTVSQMNIKSNKLILGISKCTWGIYLIHPLYINIAIKVLKIDVLSSNVYIRLLVMWGVILTISLLTVYILRKIPIIKKLI